MQVLNPYMEAAGQFKRVTSCGIFFHHGDNMKTAMRVGWAAIG